MTRIKPGVTAHHRHKKTLTLARGYSQGRRKLIRIANEQNKTSEGAAISYLMLFMVIVLTNLYLYLANRRTQGA